MRPIYLHCVAVLGAAAVFAGAAPAFGQMPGGMGGANKVVEIDETFVGGKAANRNRGQAAHISAD